MFEELKNHFENINDYFSNKILDYSLIDILKGEKSKFILLQTSLINGNDQYNKLFLRGFERNFTAHYKIAQAFFEMDLGEKIQKVFSTNTWPVFGRILQRKNPDVSLDYNLGSSTPNKMAITHEDIEICFQIHGGENFKIDNEQYLKTGESQDFGPISDKYNKEFEELRAKVFQTEHYKHINL